MRLKTIALYLPLFLTTYSYADNYQAQIDAQQRAMYQMQNQLNDMQNQINILQGKIDELKYQNSRASTAPTNNQNSTITTLSLPKESTASNTKVSGGITNDDLIMPNSDAVALYDKGYSYVTSHNYAEAITTFKKFIELYSNTKLVPNAWYWMGQVQYKDKNYKDARVSFLNVVRYTGSNKRPDSLYKLGLISRALGDNAKAKKYFELVVNTYPNDVTGNLARQELAK